MDDSHPCSPTPSLLPQLGFLSSLPGATPWQVHCCVSSRSWRLVRSCGTKGKGILWWPRACCLVEDASLACPGLYLGGPCWGWRRFIHSSI